MKTTLDLPPSLIAAVLLSVLTSSCGVDAGAAGGSDSAWDAGLVVPLDRSEARICVPFPLPPPGEWRLQTREFVTTGNRRTEVIVRSGRAESLPCVSGGGSLRIDCGARFLRRDSRLEDAGPSLSFGTEFSIAEVPVGTEFGVPFGLIGTEFGVVGTSPITNEPTQWGVRPYRGFVKAVVIEPAGRTPAGVLHTIPPLRFMMTLCDDATAMAINTVLRIRN